MDDKALKILFDYFWSPAGWKKQRDINPEDEKYAIRAGYMFEPTTITHAEAVDRTLDIVKQVSLREVTDAFLASLSTRRLDLRSALGSYVCALHLPNHPATQTVFAYSCGICGLSLQEEIDVDFSLMNFERYKWGGVRHLDPIYEMFDLTQFKTLDQYVSTAEDNEILDKIILTISDQPSGAKLADLERALSRIIQSNKWERRTLIQILGYCGILATDKYEGFYQAYTNHDSRPIPPVNKIDWTFPVCWWKGKNGISRKHLKEIFNL